jgi:4a-hydroxytetrahydrobiopterin dehydratase
MDDLRTRRCTPCRSDTPKLDAARISALAPQVPGWAIDEERLRRRISFRTFPDAIRFVNRLADLAEAEDHHPDICIHYRDLELTLWTHAVDGLSENDFILAARIDELLETTPRP